MEILCMCIYLFIIYSRAGRNPIDSGKIVMTILLLATIIKLHYATVPENMGIKAKDQNPLLHRQDPICKYVIDISQVTSAKARQAALNLCAPNL